MIFYAIVRQIKDPFYQREVLVEQVDVRGTVIFEEQT